MAYIEYHNIGISGLAACVPKLVIDNTKPSDFFSEKEAKAIVRMTGIKQRRKAPPSVCASDMCYAAASRLLSEMDVDICEIDVLLFVSQTPDYKMPSTASILQSRLNLPKSTAAFDVNLGCSGYVYGLSIAYAFCNQPSIRRVLLLNGETRTRAYSPKDKSTGMLFGDGAAATLIEKGSMYGNSYFSLNTDGSRSDYIKIKAGGYRYPSSLDSLSEKEYPDGSIRTEEQGVMDGPGVFDFTIDEVPKDIRTILEYSKTKVDELDVCYLHQANKFITDHIAKKLQISPDKVPYSLSKYGNTSSVSIPLTMVSETPAMMRNNELKVLVCGFGVGLSWASGVLKISKPYVAELLEV